MKGIILAGGSGTRLYPVTHVVSKQLMPIYDKPMIYYPLSSLMLAGIKDILIISTPHDMPLFKELLKDGSQWGIKLSYEVQPEPNGLAQALIIGEKFLNGSPCCLVLGDNIFYGHGFPKLLQKAAQLQTGGLIFGYYVNQPQAYGVIEFNQSGKAISLEEKPTVPKSNYAVPGIYFYDGQASTLAKQLTPSPRGELEITDLNQVYLTRGELQVEMLGRGVAWLDTGTHSTLLQAANFIRTIIERQGLQIGCPEEIAFHQNFISREQLMKLANLYLKTEYGQYLKQLAEN